MEDRKIKVLIVDDSSFNRKLFTSILSSEPDIEVVDTAENGKEGLEKTLKLKPDVITMDVQMPVMDGIEAISRIMYEIPTPIIVVSASDTQTVIETLSTGAMDFLATSNNIDNIAQALVEKVKIASKVQPIKRIKIPKRSEIQKMPDTEQFRVISIGSSTGGPAALNVLLSGLPANIPAAILIAQHISEGFVDGLAGFLRLNCPLNIELAKENSAIEPGKVIIAPDNCHMKVGYNQRIQIVPKDEHEFFFVPSIDLMMTSIAEVFKQRAVGIILTGMGNDGAKGMNFIKQSGGVTIAQDEQTSAIFGMNKCAIDAGCVDRILPIEAISSEIVSIIQEDCCVCRN